jgi:hypothetical protein
MKTLGFLVLMLTLTVTAWAGSVGDAVEVQIRSDNGNLLPFYPVASRSSSRRVYAEAVKGDHYTIVVRNRLDRRVGVVIAVDGRNIISGKKSWLKSSEKMYILEPYGEGEYSGWRSGLDRINRFYFTDVADSYAAAFKDESAMGVIAVAVYPEVRRYQPPPPEISAAPHGSAPAAPSSADAGARAKKAAPPRDRAEAESAGTGYGRQEYAPATVVEFEAEKRPVDRIYIKYEWRSTLCRKGIIGNCRPGPQRNRLWDNDGFAPPPPGRE